MRRCCHDGPAALRPPLALRLPRSRAEAEAGQEYALGRTLDQGCFGLVRACRPRAAASAGGGVEELACKTLPKACGDTAAHHDVEIMQQPSGHLGIVTLKAVFEDKDSFHLVMELCPGGRLLDQMVKEGRYSEHRAAGLVRELFSVIKHCHEMGVVHRDI